MTAPIPLVLTNDGMARFTGLQVDGAARLAISSIGLSDQAIVVAPTLVRLPGEHRRIDTLSGKAVGQNIVHLVLRDEAAISYGVRAFGLYLSDGTLFAVYGQEDRIVEKSALVSLFLALDIAFPSNAADRVDLGDTNFLMPPATTETLGLVELATSAETAAATDDRRVVTPFTLGQRLATLLAGINASIANAIDSLRVQLLDAVAQRVPMARRVNTAGLLLGGGALTTDITLSLPAATAAQLREASAANVALTPASWGGLGNVIGTTGSYTLPGGLILKWGGHRGRSTQEITVNSPFEQAFPNACFRVLLTPLNASGSTGDDFFCQLQGAPTPSGFAVKYQSDDANGGLDGYDWLAIGN